VRRGKEGNVKFFSQIHEKGKRRGELGGRPGEKEEMRFHSPLSKRWKEMREAVR